MRRFWPFVLVIAGVLLAAGIFCGAAYAQPGETAMGPMKAGDFVDLTKPPYNADPTGRRDSAPALQKAFDEWSAFKQDNRGRGVRTLYFPDGTYRFDDEAVLATGDFKPASHGLQIVGESREGTILKLTDNNPKYQNPDDRRRVVSFLKDAPWNSAMNNSIENLTIDVGRGNPAAVALEFVANNTGYVRNVTLRSSDPQGVGHTGLLLEHHLGGVGYIGDVRVEGFDRGISVAGTRISWPFERIELVGQRKVGLYNREKPIGVRHLKSDQSKHGVPAVILYDGSGTIALLESELVGGRPGVAAVEINGSNTALIRDVTTSGYGTAVSVDGKSAVRGTTVDEFVYDRVYTLFPGTPTQSLRLPIQETPAVPWDAEDQWVVVQVEEGQDIAPPLQRAIDSGATSVYLKRGEHVIGDTLVLRNNLRRLHLGFSRVVASPELQRQVKPLFRIDQGRQPVVMMQGVASHGHVLDQPWWLQNDTDQTVVLKDVSFGVGGFVNGVYRHTGKGDVFLENVNTGAATSGRDLVEWHIKGQNVWARGFNPENHQPNMLNDGGMFWCLSFKFGEGHGPYLVTMNNGRSEMLGGCYNARSSRGPESRAMLFVDHAELAANGAQEGKHEWPQGPDPLAFREFRDGRLAEMHQDQVTRRPDAPGETANIALYRASGSIPGRETKVGIRTIEPTTTEGSGSPIVMEVFRTGDTASELAVTLDAFNLEADNATRDDVTGDLDDVVIAAGERSARFEVHARDDDAVEDAKMLRVYVRGGVNYLVDSDHWRAEGRIEDNDVDLAKGLKVHLVAQNGRIVDEQNNIDMIQPTDGVKTAQIGGRSAIVFDGKTGQIVTSEHRGKRELDGLFMHQGFRSRTTAFWLNAERQQDGDIQHLGGTNNGQYIALRDGRIEASLHSARNPEPGRVAADWPGNGWHHVAVVYDEPRFKLFVDGRLADEGEFLAGVKDFQSGSSLGTNLFGKMRPLSGAISDFRIYDRGLSPAELQQLVRHPAGR